MSQVATRKAVHVEDKDKRTDSPVKDMKKKMAATAEKEKGKQQATDKNDKQPEKNAKADGNDNANKSDRNEKSADKKATDKSAHEKSDKAKTEKVAEKPTGSDKKVENVEKNGVEKKDEKDKKEQEKKEGKAEKTVKAKNGTERPKQNGSKQNGQPGRANGTPDSDDDVLEIADDEFPELAYDEGSDAESPTPDGAPSRSHTRRSQVKAARTPETPQPVTEKPADNAASDDSKDSKVPKVTETQNDRKLRSADPTREKEDKTPKKKDKENGEKDLEIIEIDDEEPRKPDTNYSKSRVKVSPYRRSMRLADQTTSSVTANYTGNNTTMEMDITESSLAEDSLNDSSYLQGLRAIRGRKSYKQLKEMSLRQAGAGRSDRATAAAAAAAAALAHTQAAGEPARPTAPVVGRKRKPEPDDSIEVATEAGEITSAVHSKRMRLLERIAMPFRRTLAAHPLQHRRNPEIVGINTDLPLTAPVASLDPETLKPEAAATPPATGATTHTAEVPAISVTPPAGERDGKRCVVM